MPKNMANYLTIGRVLMIPVFLVLMYVDFPGSRYWALAVYIVACLPTAISPGTIIRSPISANSWIRWRISVW